MLVAWYYPEHYGGTEAHVRMLVAELRALGYRVSVAAPAAEGEPARDYEWEGVPVHRYRVNPAPGKREFWGLDASPLLPEFTAWVERLRPDLAHIHTEHKDCGHHHLSAVRGLGIPVVRTLHLPGNVCMRGTMMRFGSTPCDGVILGGRCTACYLQDRGLPLAAAWGLAALPRGLRELGAGLPGRAGTLFGLRGQVELKGERLRAEVRELGARLIVPSQWLVDVLLRNEIPTDSISLVRYGLPADAGSAGVPRAASGDRLEVVFLGRFDPQKGLDTLIRAVRALPESARLRLRIFGKPLDESESAYQRSLEALAHGDPRIEFAGALLPQQRSALLAGADVLAVPSVGYETGPHVVLEGHASRLAVFGSRIGGIDERVRHEVDGLLLPPGDVSAWSDAFRRAATDPEWLEGLRSSIGAVRRMPEVAREIAAVYERIGR